MEPFTTLTAVAAPLLRENIDTDLIIRVEHLVGSIGPATLGPHGFAALRFRPDGSENPDFVLNRPSYRAARILLAGANFGCGSSREGAVWALQGMGLRCVIAPSFGDIFFNNCFQNGLLPIALPDATVRDLVRQVEADPAARQVTVDLAAQTVTAPDGARIPFTVETLRREMLLHGLDAIGVTLRRETEIAAFQARDRKARPWVYEVKERG
ncbi:MAG TPA: 3-isopropylmalate dehydratase small subunit [bacterium]